MEVYCHYSILPYVMFTPIGTATRYCNADSEWQEPNVLDCESLVFSLIRAEVSDDIMVMSSGYPLLK